MSKEIKVLLIFAAWIVIQPLLFMLVNRYILPRFGIRT